MNIKRIRRLGMHEEDPRCDCCDKPTSVGYELMGEHISGRMGGYLVICDKCLAVARKSPIGFCIDGEPYKRGET
jgi:hypothetical protein